MAKQHPRDFSFSQWFFIGTPTVVGVLVPILDREARQLPLALYALGGGVGLSLLILFVMVYGEDL